MPRATPTAFRPTPFRLSLFWQWQLGGWGALAVLSIPLKELAYGSLGDAILISAYQFPLSLILSAGLHGFYLRTRAFERRPAGFGTFVLAGATVAGLVDTLVSGALNHLLQIHPLTPLAESGMYFFRPAIYLIWSLAYLLIKTLRSAREQAFQTAIADERHRLELLRYQLNPDFLARSLAAISHEIGENPATARGMAARLGAFYQNTLRHTDRDHTATLGDELDLVRAYLDIESLRRPGALHVDFAVDDSLRSLPLPPVMLLPLAEQAVKAGGTPTAPLSITVTAERTTDGQILLEVANSGPPAPAAATSEVSDLHARLEQLYAGHYRFNLRQDSFTTRATICLPLPG
jgi:hypothetical protein